MYHVTNPSPGNLYKPAQTQITSFLWEPWPTGIVVWLMMIILREFSMRALLLSWYVHYGFYFNVLLLYSHLSATEIHFIY